MRRTLFALAAAATAVSLATTPVFAHGGRYKGPAGEIPPDSREPHDPPPPPGGNGPSTPSGEPGGPITGGKGEGGGPGTGDKGGGRGGGSGGPGTGNGPSGGPGTGGVRRAAKSAGYEDWRYWWSYNEHDLLEVRRAVRARLSETGTGSSIHRIGRSARTNGTATPTTDAAVRNQIVPLLRRLLHDEDLDFDTRSAAAIALAKIGDETIEGTLRDMAAGRVDCHKTVRESAALSLGILGKDSEDLRESLLEIATERSDTGSFVRPFSIVSLGLLGPGAGSTVPGLLDLAAGNDPVSEMRCVALLGVGLAGDDGAVPALAAMLDTGRAGKERLSDLETAFVVDALGRIGATDLPGEPGAVLARLADLLGSKRTETPVRRAAAVALGRMGETADADGRSTCVNALERALAGRDTATRNFALIALGRTAAAEGVSPKLRAGVLRTLRTELREAKPGGIVRPFAALAMGLVGRAVALREEAPLEEEVRAPLREAFARARDPAERSAYAVASGLVRDRLAFEGLLEVVKDDGADARLRGYSAIALGLIGDESAREPVRALLTGETDRNLRLLAARAAGLLKDGTVIGELIRILEKEDEAQYVLGSVALTLGQIGDEHAVAPLVRIAADDDRHYPALTRALAVVALGQIGDRSEIPALSRVARDVNYRAQVPALLELLTIL